MNIFPAFYLLLGDRFWNYLKLWCFTILDWILLRGPFHKYYLYCRKISKRGEVCCLGGGLSATFRGGGGDFLNLANNLHVICHTKALWLWFLIIHHTHLSPKFAHCEEDFSEFSLLNLALENNLHMMCFWKALWPLFMLCVLVNFRESPIINHILEADLGRSLKSKILKNSFKNIKHLFQLF